MILREGIVVLADILRWLYYYWDYTYDRIDDRRNKIDRCACITWDRQCSGSQAPQSKSGEPASAHFALTGTPPTIHPFLAAALLPSLPSPLPLLTRFPCLLPSLAMNPF